MSKAVVETKQAAGADLVAAYRKDFEAVQKGAVVPGAQQAFGRFAEVGIPHTRMEAFRKTDLGALRTRHHQLAVPSAITGDDIVPWSLPTAAARIVLVDGVFDAALSDIPPQVGFTAGSLATADAKAKSDLGTVAQDAAADRALWALNRAFAQDGAFVAIPPRASIDGVIHILHIATGTAQTVRHPRVLIVAGSGSAANVAETYAGIGSGATWTNAVTEVRVDQAARLTHLRLLQEPIETVHTGALAATVGRDADYRAFSFTTGSARARLDLGVTLADQGANATLNGVFLAAGVQHVDHHTFIDHAKPHGTSHENVKGILTGHAHGVFTGNILVRQDAQQTSSEQENRNLLLSRKALVDTTPQLEIHADDVKCSHGSTIGRLDEDQLFYLRSRGFADADARRTLTIAFAAEPLAMLGDGPLRDHLLALTSAWFVAHEQEGGA